MYTALLPNLLRPNFSFTAGVKVDLSSKTLLIKNYFQENLYDPIHEVIYSPHLSSGILNESFQLTPYCEACMYKQVTA